MKYCHYSGLKSVLWVWEGCLRPVMVEQGLANVPKTNMAYFPVGTVVEYRCDSGYLINGPNVLTCTALGHWSSEPPKCIHSNGCVRPYVVENSWAHHTETNRGLFAVGTVLQYSCDPGYPPDGPSILTCILPGRRSSEPPRWTRSRSAITLLRRRFPAPCLACITCFLRDRPNHRRRWLAPLGPRPSLKIPSDDIRSVEVKTHDSDAHTRWVRWRVPVIQVTGRLRLADRLSSGVLSCGGLCRAGVRVKFGIDMALPGELGSTRSPKEGCTGRGRKRSRSKPPCRSVVGSRL
ncbi:uncharacterized protein LOC133513505 [Syngnathoides biaculeatus]|uniref:uncharacterized protein LOC133513505 n=1 Tax=Syngnathoides biaculeatus TaxID=300417 RepID=UPI002ADDE90C|nr:uncharacterized protein LOC133513505 [Syngnathoides biaculeatus]